MTRVRYDFNVKKQNEVVMAASRDVLFSSKGFRSLNVGSKNKDLEVKVDLKIMTMKEAVARETAVLIEQQKRLSVLDLTTKFERGVATAAKLSSEAKLKEAASLEKHVLLKNLRESLESLKGRVAGRNKNDVDEAISLMTTLAAQLNQREGDLIQEKNEVTKLVNLLKQASENAKEFFDEERAFAHAEIEKAREAVQRVEEAIQEHESISSAFEKQAMDIKLEIRALRAQLVEKSLLLQKELALSKRHYATSSNLYMIDGPEVLGLYMEVQCCSDQAPEQCNCSVQWYHLCTKEGQGTIAKEYYSSAMLLCGVRGGGNAAAQALFWQGRRGLNFVLAFESERERNADIMLGRRFAFDTNMSISLPNALKRL